MSNTGICVTWYWMSLCWMWRMSQIQARRVQYAVILDGYTFNENFIAVWDEPHRHGLVSRERAALPTLGRLWHYWRDKGPFAWGSGRTLWEVGIGLRLLVLCICVCIGWEIIKLRHPYASRGQKDGSLLHNWHHTVGWLKPQSTNSKWQPLAFIHSAILLSIHFLQVHSDVRCYAQPRSGWRQHPSWEVPGGRFTCIERFPSRSPKQTYFAAKRWTVANHSIAGSPKLLIPGTSAFSLDSF